MLESPPIVVPANVVPVGTTAWPRNCSDGGFFVAWAPAPTTTATAAAAATASAATDLRNPFIAIPQETKVVVAGTLATRWFVAAHSSDRSEAFEERFARLAPAAERNPQVREEHPEVSARQRGDAVLAGQGFAPFLLVGVGVERSP